MSKPVVGKTIVVVVSAVVVVAAAVVVPATVVDVDVDEVDEVDVVDVGSVVDVVEVEVVVVLVVAVDAGVHVSVSAATPLTPNRDGYVASAGNVSLRVSGNPPEATMTP